MHKRSIYRNFALSSVIAASFFSTSCDTVAKISFQEREFAGIEVVGLSPAGSCDAITEGKANFRFVLRADDRTAIRPGEAVGSQDVQLSDSDLELLDPSLSETPDLDCTADSCRLGADNFVCTAETGIDSKRCQRSTDVAFSGDLEFISDRTKNRLFAVLVENSGSVDGWLPVDLGAKFPDTDNSGTGDGSEDVGRNQQRSSDSAKRRKSSLNPLVARWDESRALAALEERKTLFGLWEFSGQSKSDVRSLVEDSTGLNEWTDNVDAASGAIDALSDSSGTRANVYQAIDKLLDESFSAPEYADYDKTLVVIVDGPDDLRRPNFSADTIATKAKEGNVRIHFVHFDPEVLTESSGRALFRDDTAYWSETVSGSPIQTPCTDDSSCLNFETCREPTLYASARDASVEKPQSYSDGDKYCLPTRQEDSRFGPIHDYAKIACESGGGYSYARDGRAIRKNIDWLPLTMDGVWSIETAINTFQDDLVPTDQSYLLQTTFRVTLGGRSSTVDLSRVGRTGSVEAAQDTRLPVFN